MSRMASPEAVLAVLRNADTRRAIAALHVRTDDKRLIPFFGEQHWCSRESERRWHHCKYCERRVPTFVLTEGEIGNLKPLSRLRCCWECGSGLEVLT